MAVTAAGALHGAAVPVIETGRLSAWAQFRRNRLAVAGLAIVALLLIAAVAFFRATKVVEFKSRYLYWTPPTKR